ncbi:DivIVA domain-containing protein [Bacillus sp. FJAT-27445]|uniref:DivIVA domain-containing protein n=1 Tax=Bacillus sp. FJAT-27445 TaxID=1679166 RepID=UPI000744109D|nr:DivIVA domain-containing protein [Bacillus sp. FJAT-27445]
MIQEMIDLAVGNFPKLAKAYEKRLGQGFTATHIYTQSMNIEPGVDLTAIELTMKNGAGESILLTYTYSKDFLDMIFERELPEHQQKNDSNLLLSGRQINEKEFKRKILRGYDPTEVDALMDLIMKDYFYMESVLIKENQILKEDIEKLRGK